MIPVFIATFTSVNLFKKQIKTLIENELKSDLERVSLHFNNWKNRLYYQIKSITLDNTCKTTLKLEISEQLNDFIERHRKEYNLDYLAAFNLKGELVSHSGFKIKFKKNALQWIESTDTYSNPANKAFYQYLFSDDNTLKHIFIESVQPVYVRDEKVGYVAGGYNLSTKNSFFQDIYKNFKNNIFAVLIKNKVVCFVSNDNNLKGYYPDYLDLNKKDSSNYLSIKGNKFSLAYLELKDKNEILVCTVIIASSLKRMEEMMAETGNRIALFSSLGILVALFYSKAFQKNFSSSKKCSKGYDFCLKRQF